MQVSLNNVSLRYGDVDFLKNISITFEAGLNILLGPTLAGKTSIMRVMAGLEKINRGQVYYNDQDVTHMPVQKRNVAMVYQQFINYPGLTVYENIASPLKLQKKSKQEIEEKVLWAASVLKLEPMLKRYPLELSGGQQQRCALARSIVKESKIVLLDEPLANLDYKLREELREELPAIFAKTNSVLVYATSEPEEALKLGGNIAVMNEGEITQFGETVEVYRRPKNIQTAELFSDPPMNFVDASIQDQKFIFDLLEEEKAYELPMYDALPDGEYKIGFRPHHLLLSNEKQSNYLNVRASVAISELTGSTSFIHIDTKRKDSIKEEYRWVSLLQGLHNLKLDSDVQLSVDFKHCYLYDNSGQIIYKKGHETTSQQNQGAI